MNGDKSELARFKETARELEMDDDEARLNKQLKKLRQDDKKISDK